MGAHTLEIIALSASHLKRAGELFYSHRHVYDLFLLLPAPLGIDCRGFLNSCTYEVSVNRDKKVGVDVRTVTCKGYHSLQTNLGLQGVTPVTVT